MLRKYSAERSSSWDIYVRKGLLEEAACKPGPEELAASGRTERRWE